MKKILALLVVLLAIASVSSAQSVPTGTYLRELAGPVPVQELAMVTHGYVVKLLNAQNSLNKMTKRYVGLNPIMGTHVVRMNAFRKVVVQLRKELEGAIPTAELVKKQVNKAKKSGLAGGELAPALKVSLRKLRSSQNRMLHYLSSMDKKLRQDYAYSGLNGALRSADTDLKKIEAITR